MATFQGCPAKTPFTKLLTSRNRLVGGVRNLESELPSHSAIPRSSWDVKRPTECFSRTEVCNFLKEYSLKYTLQF